MDGEGPGPAVKKSWLVPPFSTPPSLPKASVHTPGPANTSPLALSGPTEPHELRPVYGSNVIMPNKPLA